MAPIVSEFQPNRRTDISPEKLKAIGRGNGGHMGVDYRAAMGSAMYTTSPMVVVNSGTINGYGNTIEIADPTRPGTTFFYAHLDELPKVSRGQVLNTGELIGYTGNSGSRGPTPYDPHLHYEVRVNGKPVSPRDYHKENRHASSFSPTGGDLDTTDGDAGKARAARANTGPTVPIKPPSAGSITKKDAQSASPSSIPEKNTIKKGPKIPSSISPLHSGHDS